MPYALQFKVEAELERFESLSIISKVEKAKFSMTPIVPVLKPSGQVRICGDFKVSVNQYLDLTQYPLPHIEKTFERLSGGQVFSKLYLPDAYLQVELDDESKRRCHHYSPRFVTVQSSLLRIIIRISYISINNRANSTSSKKVQPYLNDIAIKSANLNDHLRVLRHVFQTLGQSVVKLKREKCDFVKPLIKYLGQIYSCDGLRPDPENVEDIVKAPPPAN